MNYELYVLRRRHGDCYLTKFLDGTEIPWRSLNLEEFLKYDQLFRAHIYPVSQLEDEIFKLCCEDKSLVANIDRIDAGYVTIVASQIMEVSGPIEGPARIANDLNVARHMAQDFFGKAMTLICQVFPGYTPEDVYKLSYQDFLIRLAQAESRLMELGLLAEPLVVLGDDEQEALPTAPPPAPRKKEFRDLNPKPSERSQPVKNSNLRTIGSDDISFNMDAYDSHERQDFNVTQYNERPQLLDGLEYIYPEYLQLVSRGVTITPETIQQIKGETPAAVKNRFQEYTKKVLDGTIDPRSKPASASTQSNKKKKVIVRRVQ